MAALTLRLDANRRARLLRCAVTCAAVIFAVIGTASADWALLYDVDFSTPPHIVGEPPVLGDGPTPRDTPSVIFAGEPLVVAALGALGDQPCAFGDDPHSGIEQLRFVTAPEPEPHGLPEAYDTFLIEMDVLIEVASIEDQLKIFVDGPAAHSVQFNPPDEIRAIVSGDEGYDTLIGSFVEGLPVHLTIELDTIADTWSIMLDGDPVFAGAYPSQYLLYVRISVSSNEVIDPIAVDNVRIYGEVEPPCPADFNDDGIVNVLDLLQLLGAWGESGVPQDLNDDGTVDVFDLLALLSAWGACPER
jgi:hypothetical protein